MNAFIQSSICIDLSMHYLQSLSDLPPYAFYPLRNLHSPPLPQIKPVTKHKRATTIPTNPLPKNRHHQTRTPPHKHNYSQSTNNSVPLHYNPPRPV